MMSIILILATVELGYYLVRNIVFFRIPACWFRWSYGFIRGIPARPNWLWIAGYHKSLPQTEPCSCWSNFSVAIIALARKIV